MEHQYEEVDPRTRGNRYQNGHCCQNCLIEKDTFLKINIQLHREQQKANALHEMQKSSYCHGSINIASVITRQQKYLLFVNALDLSRL